MNYARSVKIYFDGSCDNNSKDKSMGLGIAVFVDGKHQPIYDIARNAGGNGTNNIAEWHGCVLAMKLLATLAPEFPKAVFQIFSDSELITNQFNGRYQIKQYDFHPYYLRAKYWAQLSGKQIQIISIPREYNTVADKLSKLGHSASPNPEID